MKKILVMPDGNWLSHTSRPFEIAKVLRKLGYLVVFASDGQYMKLPRESGFEVLPIFTISPQRVLKCSRAGLANWYDYNLIKQCVEAELELFTREKPDLVLTDFRLSVSISCEIGEIPMVMVLNAAWTNYYSVPVRAPEHLKIARIVGSRIANLLAPIGKRWIQKSGNKGFNKYRREHGLPLRGNIYDTWRGKLNLMVDIPEYSPTTNLPSDFHYIGPIVWEPDIELPTWLNDLDPNKPTIYFTMGSTGYARFFDQAIEIFGDSKYQCIMTTAGMAQISAIPSNFYVVDYAPGSEIMKRSDVVVCQGGNGTIYQAMSYGVPIIGIPTMHDQEYNLDRVEALGIGIQLSELKFKPSHLADAVEIILNNEEYRDNARYYMNILSEYNAPQKGAELIADFLYSM